MSTWAYRLVREPVEKGAALRMTEVYYRDGAAGQHPPSSDIQAWAWAGTPTGESRQELQDDLARMAAAALAPIIPATELPGYDHQEVPT